MEPGRMNQRYSSCIQQHICVLGFYCIAVILLLLCCCAATNARKGTFDKLFVLGDSFVDIGNRDPNNSTYTAIGRVNQNWTPPYGRTRPGEPAGRYSDGKVLSDILDYMGLKPRPFRLLHRTSTGLSTQVSDGINFAMAGSGVFDNQGFIKTEDQITQLKEVLMTRLYPKDVIRKSLVLYVISGNDYAAYRRNNGSTDALSIIAFVASVVGEMTRDLTKLYDMGFRSFVVGKLAPLGCVPYVTVTHNYNSCEEEYNNVTTLHNLNLMVRVMASLPHADILFLNHQIAFAQVLYNSSNPDRLKACCNGVQFGALCGDVNEAGRPLYSLCSSDEMEKFFWWDEFHPTEAGWGFIFDLFLQGFPFLYTDGKSLSQFLGVQAGRIR